MFTHIFYNGYEVTTHHPVWKIAVYSIPCAMNIKAGIDIGSRSHFVAVPEGYDEVGVSSEIS